jgi:hypothetical protein
MSIFDICFCFIIVVFVVFPIIQIISNMYFNNKAKIAQEAHNRAYGEWLKESFQVNPKYSSLRKLRGLDLTDEDAVMKFFLDTSDIVDRDLYL